ncbi:MAG TPA: single-stranded DNA-binding protein [Ignavibacteriaceae bacterium]|nr:single-stranded DNA-binding protein [Ignavibacteriaceae bacterium]
MASSLNKIMLIGNLGKDGETRFTATGSSVTSFSLATTYSFKNKDGNWVNETTWHNVMAWNASDYIKEKLKKGKKIYAEGRLSKRDYVDKDGIKRYMTEVVAEKIIPLDAAGQGEGGGEYESTREMLPEQNLDQDLSVADSDLPF